MSTVNTQEEHPILSAGPHEKKCGSKDIYSEMNYEKLRNKRILEVSDYYQKVLKKYEEKKRQYNEKYKTTAKEADNKTEELEEKTAPNASADEKLEGTEVLKPQVIRLNNQLLAISRQIMEDNNHTGKGLYQQYQDLQKQESELDKLMDNVSKLENNLDDQKNVQITRNSRMEDSYESGQSSYYWYMGLFMVNFCLLMFLVFYMILLLGYLEGYL